MSVSTDQLFPQSANWKEIFALDEGIGISVIRTDGLIHYANAGARRTFGIASQAELAGKMLGEIFHADFVAERLNWIRGVVSSGRPGRAHHIFQGRGVISTLVPVVQASLPEGVLVISRGESERDRPREKVSGDDTQPEASLAQISDPRVSEPYISDAQATDLPATDLPVPPVHLPGTTDHLITRLIDLGKFSCLGNRELEVLILLGHGYSVPEAARKLFRSPRTVERHKGEIGRKLGASTIAEIVAIVCKSGLKLEHTSLMRVNALRSEFQAA